MILLSAYTPIFAENEDGVLSTYTEVSSGWFSVYLHRYFQTMGMSCCLTQTLPEDGDEVLSNTDTSRGWEWGVVYLTQTLPEDGNGVLSI